MMETVGGRAVACATCAVVESCASDSGALRLRVVVAAGEVKKEKDIACGFATRRSTYTFEKCCCR